MTDRRLPVVEIFGPTIQGEGPQVGTQCHFVRLGGCDFRCVWCDTPHAVLPHRVREAKKVSEDTIVGQLMFLGEVPLVVVSGGNPLLHELKVLVGMMHSAGFSVSVETQGTLWKEWINDIDQVVVSPKPPSAGMPGSTRMLKSFLSRTTAPVALKVPCFNRTDVEWAAELHVEYPEYPFFISVVTLVEDSVGRFSNGFTDDAESLLGRTLSILEHVQRIPALENARVFPQLHALLWGNEKGH